MSCGNGGDFVDLSLMVISCILNCILDRVEDKHVAMASIGRVTGGSLIDTAGVVFVFVTNLQALSTGFYYGVICLLVFIFISYSICIIVYLYEATVGQMYQRVHNISFACYKIISIVSVIMVISVTNRYSSGVSPFGIFLYVASGLDLLLNYIEIMYLLVSAVANKSLKVGPNDDEE